MDYTTLKVKGSAALTEESLSLTSLYAAFQELPDPLYWLLPSKVARKVR